MFFLNRFSLINPKCGGDTLITEYEIWEFKSLHFVVAREHKITKFRQREKCSIHCATESIRNIQYLHFQIVLTDIEGLMDFLTSFVQMR